VTFGLPLLAEPNNMKKICAIVISLLMFASVVGAERGNLEFTLTAGSPQRIASQKYLVNRLMIQNRAGSSQGIILVMLGVNPNVTCNASNTAHLTAELGPGDATHPGATFSDPQGANGNSPADAEDLAWACLDTTVTGTKAKVTFWHRQ